MSENEGQYVALSEEGVVGGGVPKVSKGTIILYACLFLVFGTNSVVFGKVLYQTKAEGKDGTHCFKKPWFQNAAMFFGMMLCLIVYNVDRIRSKGKKTFPKTSPKAYYIVMVPAFCDFLATYLMNVGLLWIPASVWQMIRGSIVVFAVLIRMVWLKKKIKGFEWMGVLVIMFALCIVGVSAIKNKDNTDDGCGSGSASSSSSGASSLKIILGMSMVFVAQAVQALQTVVEEHLLHNVEASSRLIVGLEGFWGFSLCAVISMPFAQLISGEDGDGFHEDTLDSFKMLSNSFPLVCYLFIFIFVILMFNICGMRMTKFTNSVSRNIMEAVRTMFIWITGLILHTVSEHYGEAWTKWSWLQLGGFFVLVFGLFTYYQVLKFPSVFNYDDEEEIIEDIENQTSPSAMKHWDMTPQAEGPQ